MGIDISNDTELTVPGYPGVVVRASKPANTREFLLLKRFGALGELSEENIESIDAALIAFGDTFLQSWNVDLRGQPVEPNGAGFASLPATFQFALLGEWMTAVKGVTGIAAPLSETSPNGSGESSNGEPSPAQSVLTGVS